MEASMPSSSRLPSSSADTDPMGLRDFLRRRDKAPMGIGHARSTRKSHQIFDDDGDRTPTANLSQESLEKIKYADPSSRELESDAASTLAPSTLNNYAPSSINEHRTLLPDRRRSAPPQRIEKTAGRKAFEGVFYAVNVVVPVDINSEATSMRDSSLGKLARMVQGKEKWFASEEAGKAAEREKER